jgi:antitoxin MazE
MYIPMEKASATTALDRWGNSLGLRLPKAVAEAAGLREGDRVAISVEDGQIVVRRAKPKYTLQELLSGLDPATVHDEIDSGPPVGREEW